MTTKRKYEKPSMEVNEFKEQPMILCGSNGGGMPPGQPGEPF